MSDQIGSTFPDGWKTSVTVKRGGAKDRKGVAQPETQFSAGPVLVGWRATADPVDRADLTTDTAVLYDMTGTVTYEPSDRVVIPDDYPGPTGTWQVDGTPKRWPFGYEVPLRKVS